MQEERRKEGEASVMEVELLENDKKTGKMVFILRDANPAIANAIRRNAMNEVPVMAIEDVEIRKNSSVLYDEMIAHRLGLVALKTDLESYNLPDKCKCQGAGCARCQVKLTLVADEPGVVYAEELKSKDPKIKPVFGKTPIAKLLKGQKLEIEATATLGKGSVHAKWSPGLVYYKHYPIIKVVSEIKDSSLVEKFPGIFEEKAGKIIINEKEFVKSHLTDSIDEVTSGAVRLEEEQDDFVVFCESFGQLECKEIIEEAIKILDEKVSEFQKEFGKK